MTPEEKQNKSTDIARQMGAIFVAASALYAAKFVNGHKTGDLKAMATACACMAQVGATMTQYYSEGVKVYSEDKLKLWTPSIQKASSAVHLAIRDKLEELNRLTEALEPHEAIRGLLTGENDS